MNAYNPDRHHRRSIRLKGYNYSQEGAYFVTICTQNRMCLFGEADDTGIPVLNAYGRMTDDAWMWLSRRYMYVTLDAWVLRPNHFHGILFINDGHDTDGATMMMAGIVGVVRDPPQRPIAVIQSILPATQNRGENHWGG